MEIRGHLRRLEECKCPVYKKSLKDPGIYRPICLTTVPGNSMEQILLGAVTNRMIGKSEQGFAKGVLCLTNLITFYSRVTCCVMCMVGTGCLDFSLPGCLRFLIRFLTDSWRNHCVIVWSVVDGETV